MMMTTCQPVMLRPRSSDTIRPILPTLGHAGSFSRCSGYNCFAWLLLSVCILVVSGGTSAMPAAAVEGHQTSPLELGALLDAGDGAVVTLVAGTTRLAVHRAVLAARSQVFAAKFAHDPLVASRQEFVIPDVDSLELRKLVAFMYSGTAPQLPDMTPQLLEAATKYGVSGLRDAIEQQLARHLTVDNAAAKAVLAVTHNYSTLRQAAVDFIRAHVLQVVATPGWAEAVPNYPEAVVEFTRLLVLPTTETSAPATESSKATPSTQSNSDDGQTSAAATPSTSRPHIATPDDAAVSHFRAPATEGSETTPTTRPHCDDARTSTAATTSSACPNTPLDEATVSSLRSMSGKYKGIRLRVAAGKGTVQEVRALLAAGADVEGRGWGGFTALHEAARDGHVMVAQCLLHAGAQVDHRDNWQVTPLHWAAGNGHAAVVRLLLAYSADPNARYEGGYTALSSAANWGFTEVVTALLEAGADKGATDDWGRTALDLAREDKNQQLIQILERN